MNWDTVFYSVLVCGALTGITLAVCHISKKPTDQCHAVQIVEVGGCNKHGQCGVLFADGSRGTELLPVKGEAVEVCE